MDDGLIEQIVALREHSDREMTWAKIAEELGLSLSQVKKRYYKYRKNNPESEAEQGAIVIGVGPDFEMEPIEDVWSRVFKAQDEVLHYQQLRKEQQAIKLPAPCALAFVSDLHFGNPMTDYRAAYKDAEIIRDTPDMYSGFLGDGVDNWIAGKLVGLQRGQVVDYDNEWRLFIDWLEMQRDKLKFVVSGNHENWVIKIAGFDRVKDALRGTKVLYHSQEINFDLSVGPATYKVKARHKWPFHSTFNATHPIEVGWQRGSSEFDIGLGGHTHIGTFCRPFVKHQIRRYAILLGTYKTFDSFGEEIGHARPFGTGCGAIVFDREGRIQWCDDLEMAVKMLEVFR